MILRRVIVLPLPDGGFDVPGNTNSPQFEAADNACQANRIARAG
jgi:hypothetical protein